MPSIIYKIAIAANLILANNLNCMLLKSRPSKLAMLKNIRLISETTAVERAVTKLKDALVSSGFTNFEILIINRQEQRKICESKFCIYPKHIIDPEASSVFKDDPAAVCLCTRKTPYDTQEHVIQARLKLE